MKVSVLMTVRDGERYLAAALESVMAQSMAADEIIVVDDGSVDGTVDVLRSFGGDVTVVSQPRTGMASGLNRALRHAQHDILGFLDADDLWEPDALELRLDRLRGADAPDAVGGSMTQFVSPDLGPAAAARFHVDGSPTRGALFGALLFQRHRFDRFGPLDESVQLAPSIDWIARARSSGLRTAWIDPVVLRRRIHVTNMSITTRGPNYGAMLEVVRRHQQRRRAAAGE